MGAAIGRLTGAAVGYAVGLLIGALVPERAASDCAVPPVEGPEGPRDPAAPEPGA